MSDHPVAASHQEPLSGDAQPPVVAAVQPPALAPATAVPAPSPGSAPSPDTLRLQLAPAETAPIDFQIRGGLISLDLRDVPLRDVLPLLAESQGLNILTADDVDVKISGKFSDATFDEVMDGIFSIAPYTWVRRQKAILVTRLDGESSLPPESQKRELRVFPLNYVAAADVEKIVTPLLSGVGRVVIIEASSADSQKTRERVVVEDIPRYMSRIAAHIAEIDQPPRQVLIEAHILQVDLADDSSRGVDFAHLSKVAGGEILLGTPSFNNTMTSLSTYSSPAYNVGIFKAGRLSGLIECLTVLSDAKTLASPKVLALNGQESHVQIGEKLGYFVTTTTQTSTLQSVEFIDTGVVLKVTPRITDDDQVMMSVKPEISDGSVDALGLPSERTTEVDTTIMLADGMGMVIGGLIKESDVARQQKIPGLSSVWLAGKLFQRTTIERQRSEIIIALVPHIVQTPRSQHCPEQFERATAPLLQHPLEEIPRPIRSHATYHSAPIPPSSVAQPRIASPDSTPAAGAVDGRPQVSWQPAIQTR